MLATVRYNRGRGWYWRSFSGDSGYGYGSREEAVEGANSYGYWVKE